MMIMLLPNLAVFKWICVPLLNAFGWIADALFTSSKAEQQPPTSPVEGKQQSNGAGGGGGDGAVDGDDPAVLSMDSDEDSDGSSVSVKFAPRHDLAEGYKIKSCIKYSSKTGGTTKRVHWKLGKSSQREKNAAKDAQFASSYAYDECLEQCNIQEINQVGCLLMLMLNGRIKSQKDKKKNMLCVIKKFINFCRGFTDDQCKSMLYPINFLCLVYRTDPYLRENALERGLLPFDDEFRYLKKTIDNDQFNKLKKKLL